MLSSLTAQTSDVCNDCGAGYTTAAIGTAGADIQTGCICDSGYGRVNDGVACVGCVAGQYKVATGDTDCTDCIAGKYMDPLLSLQTSDVCQDCALGKYVGTAAATTCINCASGFFGPTVGLTVCAPCAAYAD